MSTEAEVASSDERDARIGTPTATSRPDLNEFLAELLGEQQRLQTPVARFADAHTRARNQLPALSAQLIPLTAPGPGEQYAFEIDLDACSGCKACVAGCHSLNGLDDQETWRDVGLVLGGGHLHPFQQTITSACHHCEDPACANGCPVLAYEKDPVTGIVRHLDDQCIGCGYCILKCPYDVPKFNDRLGIVRKCDMCHGRLAAGEAPACVQACPTHAIKITKVAVSHVSLSETHPGASRHPSQEGSCSALPSEGRGPATRPVRGVTVVNNAAFLPASVATDPAYTRPTTRYISKRPLPADLRAADSAVARVQPAHWPLVLLLTLMAMAVGCSMTDKVLGAPTPTLAVLGWLAGAVGLVFSVLHLGQPLRAWRVFLGLQKSWLSREAMTFGLWFPLATVYTAARLDWLPLPPGPLRPALALAGAIVGSAGLFCSVMIYADTRREFWRFTSGAPRLFGSAAVLGLASALAATPSHGVALALTIVMIFKLAFEMRALRPLDWGDDEGPTPQPAYLTARLLSGPLRPVLCLRLLAGLFVGLASLVMVNPDQRSSTGAWLVLACALAGELAERYLFFRAVVAPKMPGLPAFVPAKRRHA